MSHLKKINGNKVALFSDLHLGVHQHSEKWLDTSFQWAQWFIQDLQKRKINTALFGGDWFHHRNTINVNTLHKSAEILELFKNAGIHIYGIVGNHDCFFKDTAEIHSTNILKDHAAFTIFDKTDILTLAGTNNEATFCMCPWGTELSQIQKADFVLGHFEIKTFKMNKLKVCDFGFNATDLLSRSDLVFSGHFHLPEIRKYKKGHIVYIGNPFEMDMHDINSTKGYIELDISTKKYEFVPNSQTPKHVKVLTSQIDKVDFKELKGNIVRIVVDNDISDKELSKIATKINVQSPFETSRDVLYRFSHNVNLDVENQPEEIDIPEMIEQFIDQLGVENKDKIKLKTLEVYRKGQETV